MKFLLTISSIMFAVAIGCGTSRHALRGGDAPSWANRAPGGWLCTLDGRKGFCSMGMVSGIKGNAAMRRTSAAERARAGLQRLFDTYSAALYKSYQASTTDFADAGDEQHVQEALKTFTAGHLSGVEIHDYWEDEKDNGFALAFLSIDSFKAALDRMGDLSSKARSVIRANADQVFDELSREEAKRGAK